MEEKNVYNASETHVSLDNLQRFKNKNDETYAPKSHGHSNATTGASGFMSNTDKAKLDGIAAGANNYVHPNDANTRHVTDAEKTAWNGKAAENHGHSTATTATSGFMSNTDKAKLDGIATGANNYVHPGSGTNPHGTTKADVGLGSVNNWGTSSDVAANSTTQYATTNMVAKVRAEKLNTTGGTLTGMLTANLATNQFKGYRNGDANLNNRLTSDEMAWSYTGVSGYTACTNGFPMSNNANGILSFNTHSGAYGHQIGFSSNGSVYHRSNSSGSWDGWRPFYKPGDWIGSPIYSTGATNLGGLGTNGFSTNFHIQGTGGIQNTVGCGMGLHDNGNIYFWNNKGAAANHYSLTISRTSATFGGTVSATAVYNAVWNDYAEFFQKDLTQEYEAGDLISLNSESDEEVYYKSGIECDTNVVGVYSDEYGHLIGGDEPPEGEDFVEYNSKKFIPVGLAGRVRVKIIGLIKKGDFVVSSSVAGVGRKYIKGQDDRLAIFGLAVETKDTEEISRVKIKIK